MVVPGRVPPAVTPTSSDDEVRGNGGKLYLLVLLAFVTFLSIDQHAKHFGDGNILQTSPNASRKPRIYDIANNGTSSFYSSPIARASSSATYNMKQTQSATNKQQQVSVESLPIYLLQSATNQTAHITWGTLAKQWNRITQYNDLLDIASPIPSLPANSKTLLSEHRRRRRRRPVVMIHCGPKTGSTTLRKACKINLEKTCNGIVEREKGNHHPQGYMDETKLYPLMRKCTNTSHFCAKEVIMPSEVPPFEDVVFLHMFPFRNYDEWAASALKQQYDRGREEGCNKTFEQFKECEPSRMEIDFRKYGKTELSRFKEGVVRRMNDYKEEHHVFLLYHHRELNDVLRKLSDLYGIPLLPGSDGKGKEVRPMGKCSQEIEMLQMYHDCFSPQLMELV